MIQEPSTTRDSQVYEYDHRVKTTEIPIILDSNTNQIKLIIKKIPSTRATQNLPPIIKSPSETILSSISSQQVHQKPKIIVTKNQIISAPFLPGSVPKTFLVKKNLNSKNVLIKNSNQLTTTNLNSLNAQLINTETVNTLKDTIFYPNTFENSLNYIKNSKNKINTNTIKVLPSLTKKVPTMTLASMAGIQLTDVVESGNPDMSGAMQPTATVEEINVPVFIDEYLQQTETSNNINNNQIITIENNIYNNTNNNNSNENSVNANISNLENCEETYYENFEFDLDLIESENYNLIEEEEKQNQQQHQMLDNDYENNFCSDHNNYNNYTVNNTNFLLTSSQNDNNNTNIMNCNSNCDYNNLKLKLEAEKLLEQHQYHTLPNTQDEIVFSEDTMNITDYDLTSNEYAIDINQYTNDNLSLTEVFTSSQNDPMIGNSQSGFIAEPVLSVFNHEDFERDLRSSNHSNNLNTYNNNNHNHDTPLIPEEIPMDVKEEEEEEKQQTQSNEYNKFTIVNQMAAKRVTGKRLCSTSHLSATKKKRRLNLDIPQVANNCTLSTPDVIDFLDNNQDDDSELPAMKDFEEFFKFLVEQNENSLSSYSLLLTNENSNYSDVIESSTCSPSSFTSYHTIPTTNNGDITNTSPNSPAFFIASPANSYHQSQETENESKRKRGRPAKQHSDGPDPTVLATLKGDKRKEYENRVKNNEASRKSRAKNKDRECAEIEMEQKLIVDNQQLKNELEKYNKKVTKYRGLLEIIFNENRKIE